MILFVTPCAHLLLSEDIAISNKMRVNATLLLAAIAACGVEADAFVSTSTPLVPSSPSTKRVGKRTKMPLTAASSMSRSSQQQMTSWSTTALEMSGGEGEAISTEGTATIPDEIFNLVKSIVGAGVLSLPAGAYIYLISFNHIVISMMIVISMRELNTKMLLYTKYLM